MAASPGEIFRGDLWYADLNPVRGHEQGGARPVLIVSVDSFHQGRSGLVWVLPITSVEKKIRSRIALSVGEGGLSLPSFVICEAIRSISIDRLDRRLGTASTETLAKVENWVKTLLGI
ncbi:type II toxin-antitoxin system PemK/MazF family toxin [Paludisphaera borealis]|uniref:mRNA interferase n=1 Tax=Paludisphaera borealis TaxID=1387353 RepID=A0A1U7CYP2_9BACT|nr:type II toxin-antitoxin system PemK/MazF family toxin [Paludisphaera borealis]APW64008.1 Endoribonuclease MazF [Paludisphaera borealis]